MSKYDIVLRDTYYLGDVIEGSIDVEDSIDNIALRISFTIIITPDFPSINNGDDIKVLGVPFGGVNVETLYSGVVWDIDSDSSGLKRLTVEAYDRTKYLHESEDQWQFPSGQTASDRIKEYSKKWGIPIGRIADTGTTLSRTIYRPQTIFQSIKADLRETALKGGRLYKPRINGTELELYEIGSNDTVYVLDGINFNVGQKRTLEGVVTQVKILGAAKDDQLAPVKATKTGRTDFGTLQRIVHAEKAEDLAKAELIAASMLSPTFKETFRAAGLGVNTIRAGDAVRLETLDFDLYVVTVQHQLGAVDKMRLTIGSMDYIKGEFFGG